LRIILIGLPGAGKGTQGKLLSSFYGIPRYSIGDIVRQEVQQKSPIGQRIYKTWDKDKWQPLADDLAIEIAMPILGKDDWILDGFPRNMNQVSVLCGYYQVIYLRISDAVSMSRCYSRNRGDVSSRMERLKVERDRFPPLLKFFENRLTTIDGEKDTQSVQQEILDAILPF
jgi:adenylate kinase